MDGLAKKVASLAMVSGVKNMLAESASTTSTSDSQSSSNEASGSSKDPWAIYLEGCYNRFRQQPVELIPKQRSVLYHSEWYAYNMLKTMTEGEVIKNDYNEKVALLFGSTLAAERLLCHGQDGGLAAIGDRNLYSKFEELFPISQMSAEDFISSPYKQLTSFLTSSTVFSEDFTKCLQGFMNRGVINGNMLSVPLFAQNFGELKRFLNHLSAGYANAIGMNNGLYLFENSRSSAFRLCSDLVKHFNLPVACNLPDSPVPRHIRMCCIFHMGRCDCGHCNPWTAEVGNWVKISRDMRRKYRKLYYKDRQFGRGFHSVFATVCEKHMPRDSVRFVTPTAKGKAQFIPHRVEAKKAKFGQRKKRGK